MRLQLMHSYNDTIYNYTFRGKIFGLYLNMYILKYIRNKNFNDLFICNIKCNARILIFNINVFKILKICKYAFYMIIY